MNLATILVTIQWMVRDTLRQAIASKLVWVLLAAVGLSVLLCLSVSVKGDSAPLPLGPGEVPESISRRLAVEIGAKALQAEGLAEADIQNAIQDGRAEKRGREEAVKKGVDVPTGEISVGFGLIVNKELGRDRKDSVRFLQIWLAGLIADTAGILVALIWTAGFFPSFLDPNHVTVLLAKPVPRWCLLMGKFLGIMLFVTGIAILFVVGTWIALGLRTGVYDGLYLLSIPLMVLHFFVFFSFSTLLAVWTRNAVVCLFATLLIWMISWGMNFGWVVLAGNTMPELSGATKVLLDVCYWVMPKPLDLNMILYDVLKADGFTMKVPEFEKLQKLNLFKPLLSMLASFLFGLVMLVCAIKEWESQEY
jgi:ABC-type transport system involved in multi-copper enzyme maturation permease subunit